MEKELYSDVKQFITEHKARVVSRPILISEGPHWLCDHNEEHPRDRSAKYKRTYSDVEKLAKETEDYALELRAKLAEHEERAQKIDKVLREMEAFYVLNTKPEWTVEKRKEPEPSVAVPDTPAAKKPAAVIAKK